MTNIPTNFSTVDDIKNKDKINGGNKMTNIPTSFSAISDIENKDKINGGNKMTNIPTSFSAISDIKNEDKINGGNKMTNINREIESLSLLSYEPLENETEEMREKRINRKNEKIKNVGISSGYISTLKLEELLNIEREEVGMSPINGKTIMMKIRKEHERLTLAGKGEDYVYMVTHYLDSLGRKTKMYVINARLVAHLRDVTINADRIGFQSAYELLGGEVVPQNSIVRYEDTFMVKLFNQLGEMGIEISRNSPIIKYRVDAYIPRFNLSIEYDERFHEQATEREKDAAREARIKNRNGSQFIRLSYRDSDEVNIGKVMSIIMDKIVEESKGGSKND